MAAFAVFPQHGGDSGVSSTNEELKPAVYYERLKILRQRQGLENTSRVSARMYTHTHTTCKPVFIQTLQ